MNSELTSPQQSLPLTSTATSLQTAGALFFGALVLFAVGFVPMDAVHNAAHDSRHAMAFPCH